MAKLLWSEYALKEAVKTIQGECNLHTGCSECPLSRKNKEDEFECIFKQEPYAIDVNEIYPDKEY